MYKIIGANNAEYGPVGADTIRQWIAEGRINAQTQIQLQGETGWKPISSYPEFAGSFGPLPPAPGRVPPPNFPPSSGASPAPASPQPFISGAANPYMRQTALDKINGPSIALLVASILGILWSLKNLVGAAVATKIMSDETFQDSFKKIPNLTPEMQQSIVSFAKVYVYLGPIIAILTSVLVLAGAIQMRKLSSYGLCMTAAIIALIPCVSPCCGILSIPFGIWALVVLCNAEVKSQFS